MYSQFGIIRIYVHIIYNICKKISQCDSFQLLNDKLWLIFILFLSDWRLPPWLLELYNYHVGLSRCRCHLCSSLLLSRMHINLGGVWSFVRELKLHLYVRHPQRSITTVIIENYLSKIIRASDHPYLYEKGGRFVSYQWAKRHYARSELTNKKSLYFLNGVSKEGMMMNPEVFFIFFWLEHFLSILRPTMRWLTWGWHFLVTRRDSGHCLSSAVLEQDSPCGIWKGKKYGLDSESSYI